MRRYLPLPRVLLAIALTLSVVATHAGAHTLELPPEARPIGLWVVAVGLSLIAWSLMVLGEGMLGGVEPTASHLVSRGPYRYMRHPIYLGMLIAMVAYGVAASSWPGLVATSVLVVPAIVFRAAREERALARAFPTEWPAYRRRTGAFVPRPPRWKGLRQSV